MKNFKISHLFAATLFVVVLFMFGCKQNVEQKYTVYGTWASSGGDSYVITATSVVYDDGGYGFEFTRNVAEITDSYIYLTDGSGNYYATAYKELTDSACKFSNAYKQTGVTSKPSLSEAKTEFTIANGYFEYFGNYSKQ